ncbi:MAG TPA: hypothetical protein VLE99_04605 [Candidatus Saccharimonadales bacterium]|nr:hypothetical protein [Candidatus Saccharimonadales bacterium]
MSTETITPAVAVGSEVAKISPALERVVGEVAVEGFGHVPGGQGNDPNERKFRFGSMTTLP